MAENTQNQGPRWLNHDEQRTWRAYLLATRLLMEQFERDLQAHAGIPLTYYEILGRLSEAPDRTLRMSHLADELFASRSRLSHAVARLEEMGWVRREQCPGDRRGALAVMTDEGFAALEQAAPSHVESVRRHLFDQLTAAQLDGLREVSEHLRDHLVSSLGLACPPDAADATRSSDTPS
ncbi:MAG TPA: MarR family transcriptional regulator [Acidimicrobiia bacterium]|jgi:DNA-binding MarR family transcriptional regulator